MALDSIKIGGIVGSVGLLITLWMGDSSSVDVARVQPMKLAAMEGLYEGSCGAPLTAVGILNPEKSYSNDADPYLWHISIPKGLSFLANHDMDSFVPGINNLVKGYEINACGDTVATTSYAERIAIGKRAHEALRAFDRAMAAGDKAAMDSARLVIKENYKYFGYGYLDSPEEAIPPVAVTFYSFHIMVIIGGYLVAFLLLVMIAVYNKPSMFDRRWLQWLGIISIPLVWICSQAGWLVAEFGRQPWVIQDIMPCKAAISVISTSDVIITFVIFAVVFTALLAAEISIMCRQISKGSKADYSPSNTAEK